MKSKLLLTAGLLASAGLATPAIPAPLSGTYACITRSYGPPIFGSTFPSIQYVPSLLGKIVLDGKGGYKVLNKNAGSGKYAYSAATQAFAFTTGSLKGMAVKYLYTDDGFKDRSLRLQFLDKDGSESATHCTLSLKTTGTPLTNVKDSSAGGAAGTAAPRAGNPNPGVTGTLLFSNEDTIMTLDLKTGQKSNRLSGADLDVNPAGALVYLSSGQDKLNFADAALKFQSSFALAPADDGVRHLSLSPDGQLVAYARTGWPPSLVIRRRSGEVVKQIEAGDTPNFLSDGRLLYSESLGLQGAVPGLWLLPKDLGTPKKIPVRLDDLRDVVVSPDEKKIAFIAHGDVYTAGLDGSNPVRRTNTAATEQDVNWASDSQGLVFTVSSYYTLFVLLPGDKEPRQVRDAQGGVMTARGRIVWRRP